MYLLKWQRIIHHQDNDPRLLWSPWLWWAASAFSCRKHEGWEISCGEGTWGTGLILSRRSGVTNNPALLVHSLGRVSQQARAGAVSLYDYHHPGGIICSPQSSLETLQLTLGAGISIYHKKLYSLNTLNAIFSVSEEFEEHNLLSIPYFKWTVLMFSYLL